VSKINDLTSGSAVIIGTVFKAMDLKPSVLDEFSFEVGILHGVCWGSGSGVYLAI